MKIVRRFYSSVLLAACLVGGVSALPEGANITHGNVQITNSGGKQTVIQGSDRAIINWNGFNIDIGELVQFIQPSSISAILNRVVGQDPSVILGSLQANGQVFLINPNGVVFGDSARVDVGSLVVSTLNITDDNFLQGNLRFEQAADRDLAAVINHGTIKIDNNGFLVLTGPMVANEGVILARVGQVALAAGTKSTISFDPTGMIQVELPTASQSSDGIVSLTHGATSDLLSSLVTAPSSKAGQIVVRDGRTFLEVASGTVVNTGEIRADGTDGLDAGRVLLHSTANTLLANGSVLSAAGRGVDSSGGEVYVLSEGRAISSTGSLIDVSGGETGDGGFAEQSSRSGRVGATLDLSAENGVAGTFLIDPERILVQSGAGSELQELPPDLVVITQDYIESISSGTVELVTEDGIDFEALNDGVLALRTDVNLSMNLTNPGGDGSSAITFANEWDFIRLSGTGTFSLMSVTGTDVENLQVVTDFGSVYADIGTGHFSNTSFQSTSGDITVTGQGSISVNTYGDATLESTGNLELYSVLADNINGGGESFDISGMVRANNRIEFDISGSIGGYGDLEAPEVSIKADSILRPAPSASPFLDPDFTFISAKKLDLEANHIRVNYFTLYEEGVEDQEFTLDVTNPTGDTDIRLFGEVDILSDRVMSIQGGDSERSVNISGDALNSISYTTEGDIHYASLNGETVTLVTDGSVDAFASGEQINITGSSVELSTGGVNSVHLVATAGDAIFSSWGESNTAVTAQATGMVDIDSPGSLTVDLVAGTLINVSGTSMTGTFDAPVLNASSSSGDILLTQSGTQDTSVSAVSVSESSNVTITTNGNLSTRQIMGNNVVLTTTGPTPKSITRESDKIVASSLTLNASGGVNVDVEAPLLNLTTGNGDATVRASGEVYVVADIAGDISLEVSEGMLLIEEILATGDVNLTAGPNDIWTITGEPEDSGLIKGQNVVLSGGNISATVDALSVSAQASNEEWGSVYLDLLSDSTVSGSATQTFQILSEKNLSIGSENITSGSSVYLTGADISGPGTIDTSVVSISAESADLNLGSDVYMVDSDTSGNATFRGTSTSLGVMGDAGGNFEVSNTGSVSTSETSISAINAVFSGSSVFAVVSAETVQATATAGDVILELLGESTTVSASSTGTTSIEGGEEGVQALFVGSGNISGGTDVVIRMSGDIRPGTGVIDAPSVFLEGSSVDVSLGANTNTANAWSTEGDTRLQGSSAALTVDVVSAGDVDIQNTGSLEIGETGVSGDIVHLSASSISSIGSVSTEQLNASATAGDINLRLRAPDSNITVINADATGSIFLNAPGPESDVANMYGLGVGVGHITAGTLIDIQAPGLTTMTGAGRLNAPSVIINAGSMNISLGADVTEAQVTANFGDLFLDLIAPETTIEATGVSSNSQVLIDSTGNLTIGANGVTGGTHVSMSAGGSLDGEGVIGASSVSLFGSTIDVVIADNISSLYSSSDGSTTITSGAESFTLNPTGSTGSASTYTFRNTVGSINSDFSGVDTDHVVLDAATGINSTLTSENVTATSESGDVTLNLQAASTTLNAGANGEQGDLLVNSTGHVVVDTTLGLQADQSVTVVTPTGTVSGEGLINAPAVSITANIIDTNLGAQVDSLSTSSNGNTSVVADSLALQVNAFSGESSTVDISNTGDLHSLSTSGGNVKLTSGGELTGTATAPSLSLQGREIDFAFAAESANAVATSGDVLITSSSGTISGSANGSFEVLSESDIAVGNITASEILLQSSSQEGEQGTVISDENTRLTADSVTASGRTVSINTQAQQLTVTGNSGVNVNNTTSQVTSAQLTSANGEVRFHTDASVSNLDVQGIIANIEAGGALSGSVSTYGSAEIQAQSVNLSSLSASQLRLATTGGNAIVNATPNSDFFEVIADVAGDLNLTTSTGDIILYQASAEGQANLTASDGGIRHNSELPGSLTAASTTLSALNDIDLTLSASNVTAISTQGEVNLKSEGSSPITVSGSSLGDFSVTAQGEISHRAISGANVTLNAASNDITGGNGTEADVINTSGTVTLLGRNITADTRAGSITATASNNATLSNFSNTVNAVNINAGRDASFTSVGAANIEQLQSTNNLTLDVGQAVTGSFRGNVVNLAGTSVDVDVEASQLAAVARTGNATVRSQSEGPLTLSNSSAAGNFELSHQGSVNFDRIQAQNVTITAAGDITDTANTIIASGITLNGNNVFVNTQGQVIVINARGNVTISNTVVDVDSLTVDAGGNVNFGTTGNLAINQVAGGQLVSLTSGKSMTITGPNSFVGASNVKLNAGGTITPDLNNPLQVRATESIEVTAHTLDVQAQGLGLTPSEIAAALSGELPVSGFTVGDGSGPIYYNGVLINAQLIPDVTPGPVPPLVSEVVDQLGQQNGQVVDDGSVGSAANDGIVQQSATQKLVAQLTETANGGEGLETSVLITLEVDALGEVQVKLSQPSPFDNAINNSDDMTANDILDLETEELNDIKVSLYYDPATDQLVLAVDLRADDILDLDVSSFQEIPIKLNYTFLSDPKLLIEKLRADDIIDLEVEDLGQIPIRVHLEGDDRSARE